MADSDQDNKIIKFENLNMLGKAVFIGGVLTRVATNVVDTAIKATADIVVEAEKAFRQGIDPNVEDAKIIEELNDEDRSST